MSLTRLNASAAHLRAPQTKRHTCVLAHVEFPLRKIKKKVASRCQRCRVPNKSTLLTLQWQIPESKKGGQERRQRGRCTCFLDCCHLRNSHLVALRNTYFNEVRAQYQNSTPSLSLHYTPQNPQMKGHHQFSKSKMLLTTTAANRLRDAVSVPPFNTSSCKPLTFLSKKKVFNCFLHPLTSRRLKTG